MLSLPRPPGFSPSGTSSPSPWWPWQPLSVATDPEARETSLQRATRRGDYLAAGEFWQQDGRLRRALGSFLKARAWGRAADVARTLGDLPRAAQLYEREGGQFLATAASLQSRLGNDAEARALWLRWGSTLVESRQPELAIEPFLRAGDSRRAAHATELALAGQRLSSGHVDTALRAAREAKRPALGAQAALIGERFREAGDLFLVANEPLAAALCLHPRGRCPARRRGVAPRRTNRGRSTPARPSRSPPAASSTRH